MNDLEINVLYMVFLIPLLLSNIYSGVQEISCNEKTDSLLQIWFNMNSAINLMLYVIYLISTLARNNYRFYLSCQYILCTVAFVEFAWLSFNILLFINRCANNVEPNTVNVIMKLTIFYNVVILIFLFYVNRYFNKFERHIALLGESIL